MSAMNHRVLELIERKRYTGNSAFYTNPDLNGVLGAGDRVILHAIIDSSGTDGTSGISAKLTVVAEDSSDGINFAEFAGSPLIDVPINDENVRAVVDFPHGRFLRFSVQLHPATGTTAIAYANMTMRASIKNA